ncbi:phage tail tape measure protein, TP901 family, core region [Pseudomonas sp. 43mfcvi1.1]|uniref:phage tail tape measure protein n=1 Tax=Pseudomonas sp. 43mfcvi1.1 TaxID=1761894 RepID=UPI000D6B46E7|nr:phage tail tape measure protein [Pseudomonas sp. 43mfcvi1.1]PWJ30974.1 TP901 family phage tail tape measure protein [Pseudomonas sp. 43mfcvi1.1]SSB98934.1 phage tail tape measure protein, TP901 family, core region [Pseudomonas sp. 43mfcvi1.1]
MADDRYSLKYAAFNESGLAFGNTSLASGVSAQGAFARDQLSSLDLALETLGLKLGLLTTAIESLTVKLSAQRLFSQTMGVGAKGESANEPKGKSGGGIEPPESLKPAIAMDSAMADLKLATQFTPRQIAEMAEPTQQIARAPLVAAGGTKAVDLVRIESLAASAGIGRDLPHASDRQFELLRFASDVGVTASAFRKPAMEVAEMMVGWRTSMKLSGAQAFDLADAINQLSKIPGGAKPGDIGAVLQRDGAAATTAGLAPAQAAALTAALLNTGTQQAEAGVALDHFTTALGKGDRASATEQAAWKQLGLEPNAVASGLRDKDTTSGTVMTVLAALNAQPADKRLTLASSLFGSGDESVLRMAQKLADVNEAFGQVKDPAQYATSQLGDKGSVRQDALALSNTQQGQWNVLGARAERLSVTTGNALAPVADSSLQALGSLADGMSELAESSPKATAAIVLVAAAIKPLVSALLKAVTDELSNQAAKRVLGAASVGAGVSASGSLVGVGASIRTVTRFIPGAFALSAAPEVVEGAMSGDARMIGAGLGTAGGGWAGASAGATAGATVGTFFGPLGTAIGGALGAVVGGLAGSWIGGESGSWLGDQLATPADKLPPPDQAAKALTNVQATTAQNTMTANIYINGQDQASASQLANLVVQQLSGQFGLTTMPNTLAMRSDAALTDGGT